MRARVSCDGCGIGTPQHRHGVRSGLHRRQRRRASLPPRPVPISMGIRRIPRRVVLAGEACSLCACHGELFPSARVGTVHSSRQRTTAETSARLLTIIQMRLIHSGIGATNAKVDDYLQTSAAPRLGAPPNIGLHWTKQCRTSRTISSRQQGFPSALCS